MIRFLPLWLVLGISFLGAQGWEGDQAALPVPATAAARQSPYSQGLIAKTPVERIKPAITTESGIVISVRQVRAGVGENQLWEMRWEPGKPWGAGTWVAFRDGLGELREARIMLLEASDAEDRRLSQPGTWLRLVPQGKGRGCRLDVFLAGRLVTGGWTIQTPLVEILSSDDPWLWESTQGDIDWPSLIPSRRWEDEKVETLRTRMHKLLSTVPAAPRSLWWPDAKASLSGAAANGAAWGSWTLLPGEQGMPGRGLGSWGVSLWTATGVLRGWKAPFPTWDSLLEQRIELPGYSRALVPEELASDPAFAMDWVRNLGLAVYQTLYPSRPRTNDSADVKGLPFLSPLPNAGYSVDDFPAVAHLLAVTKPGQIYLATLSTQSAEKGKSSAVSFLEPAVILPWIGTDQRLRVAVYSGPKEQGWEEWLAAQVPSGRKGVRADHLALIALPLPPSVELPLLPAR